MIIAMQDVTTQGELYLEIFVGPGLEDIAMLEAALPGVLEEVMLEAGSFWETLAGQHLNSTREVYMAGMDISVVDGSTRLSLQGSLATKVEEGSGPFDMKPGLLARPNRPGGRRVLKLSKASDKYGWAPRETEFRTIGPDSPSDSWIHPGFEGVHLLDFVAMKITDEIAPEKISALVESLYGN